MRLQVTLALICVLLPKALTLKCYQCTTEMNGTCTDTADCTTDLCASSTSSVGSMGHPVLSNDASCVGVCHSQQKFCLSKNGCLSVTTFYDSKRGDETTAVNMKTCGVAGMCITGSVNLGLIKMTYNSKCCSTDLCNSQTVPALPKGSPNGRQCYTCSNNDCSTILNCEGDEDQCISYTVDYGSNGGKTKVKGCASKFYCTGSSMQQAGIAAGGAALSCCSGNLCNGDADVPVPALKCYQCMAGMSGTCTTTTQCPDQCASVTTTTFTAGAPTEFNMKTCGAADTCFTGSLNLGLMKTTVNSKCCNTDLCNNETVPALPKGSPNGLQCYVCYNNSCTGTVNCEGDEDQCISVTVSSAGVNIKMKGCASKSFCTGTASTILPAALTGYGGSVSCCSGNLCNGATDVPVPALKCYQCTSGMSGTCTTTAQCSDQCASITSTIYTDGVPAEVNMKTCGVAGLCITGSLNLGLTKTTYNSKCCSTDLCNNETMPALPKGSPNGLQCYTCNNNNNNCEGIVNCEGDEDQCIKITVSSAGVNVKMKGCASKSLCTGNASTLLPSGFGGNVSCCSGNLCNSAAGVNLSLLIMLVPLFFSILFI